MASSVQTKDFAKGFMVNRIAWFALIILTLSTYFVAAQDGWSSAARPVIIASLIGKFLLIFFIFMEMKHAHWAWWLVALTYSFGLGLLFLSLL